MAKTYRAIPLARVTFREDNVEDIGLPILNKRKRASIKMLGRLVGKFDTEFIFQAATEVGLDECIRYTPDGEALEFDLTALQAVSLAYALAACWEIRRAGMRAPRKPKK